MPERPLMMAEVGFDLLYLAVVWWLVALMARRRRDLTPAGRPAGLRLLAAFSLLALGDTGHVGFRVLAYALGGLESHSLLVGVGALCTAVTVTGFYAVMLDLWRVRFGGRLGLFGWTLLAAGAARLVVMAFPQNQWGRVVPPWNWSLARNALLVVQGIGVLLLIARDSARTGDRAFAWIAAMIGLSFGFYAPVILLSSRVPLLGMLMIPKTCAYVAVAAIGYRALYPRRAAASGLAVQAGAEP